MKKLFVLLTVLFSTLVVSAPALAKSKPARLPASYRAVYCYPTGSYWASQVSAYPDYYAQNNAFYTARYGAHTIYC
jgi:hypothetical protein